MFVCLVLVRSTITDRFLNKGGEAGSACPSIRASAYTASPAVGMQQSLPAQEVEESAPPAIIYGFQDPTVTGWPRQHGFSWASIVATARRNRLTPEILGWLVFLKRNARFMPTDEEMAAEYLRRYRVRS